MDVSAPTREPASGPSVIAKCPFCGSEREIKAGEISPTSHPMCDQCFMPMVAKEARR